MVEIADIRDAASLREWLESRSREEAVWIASRAAMRVLPVFWEWTFTEVALKNNLTALPVLSGLLVSSVATVRATQDIKAAAANAAVISAATANTAAGSLFAAGCAANAAAYCTYAAAYSVNYAANASAAIAAAANAATGEIWSRTRRDCEHVVSGPLDEPPPLWLANDDSLVANWRRVKFFASEPIWGFWIGWYEAALSGAKPEWDQLERFALQIKSENWRAGPNAVAKEIERIIEEGSARKNSELFAATLFDFSFDKMAGVMRAIPLPADWKHLDDADRLAGFLEDAADLREDMDLFADALAAEGAARQGAGAISKYLKAVLAELARAEDVGLLRVGKLMEYGRILERMCLAEETRREFGVLTEPLELNVSKLKELIRNHFAYTLARFAVLREIRMEPDAAPWEVLREFRFLVEDVRTGAKGELPRLAEEDAAVLVDVLDSVDAQIRALEATDNDDLRSSIQREVNFQLAKILATGAVFGERATVVEAKSAKKADFVVDWFKRGSGLLSILKHVRDVFF